MSSIESLRNDIADEMDAFSDSVDDLESTVSEAEAVLTSNKLYDREETTVVERDTAAPQPTAAD